MSTQYSSRTRLSFILTETPQQVSTWIQFMLSQTSAEFTPVSQLPSCGDIRLWLSVLHHRSDSETPEIKQLKDICQSHLS